MLPLGIVLVEVKSLFRNRTVPVDGFSSTRFPVTSNVWLASTGMSFVTAGTTRASGSAEAALGSATMRRSIGPISLSLGAMTAVAVGRKTNAPTPPTTSASARTASPMATGVRARVDPKRSVAPGAGRTREPPAAMGSGGVSATTRAAGIDAGTRWAIGGLVSGRGGNVAGASVASVATPAPSPALSAAAAPATAPAAAAPSGGVIAGSAPEDTSGDVSPRGFRPPLPRGDREGVIVAAAAAPASALGASTACRGFEPPSSSIDDSYSATVAKIGSPAEAARARVAPSPATIDSRLPLSVASRESNRKLMRDVATREP